MNSVLTYIRKPGSIPVVGCLGEKALFYNGGNFLYHIEPGIKLSRKLQASLFTNFKDLINITLRNGMVICYFHFSHCDTLHYRLYYRSR